MASELVQRLAEKRTELGWCVMGDHNEAVGTLEVINEANGWTGALGFCQAHLDEFGGEADVR